MTAYCAYWAYFAANLRSLLRYRMAAVAGFLTQAFWGLLKLSIFTAFYAALGAHERPPMSAHELTAYVWLGQGLFVLLPVRPDPEVLDLVREGGLAYELARPVDLYSFWFSRSLALRIAPALLRLPLVVLFAFLVPSKAWALALPPSPLAFAFFIVALSVSVVLSGTLTALLSVYCVWPLTGLSPSTAPEGSVANRCLPAAPLRSPRWMNQLPGSVHNRLPVARLLAWRSDLPFVQPLDMTIPPTTSAGAPEPHPNWDQTGLPLLRFKTATSDPAASAPSVTTND